MSTEIDILLSEAQEFLGNLEAGTTGVEICYEDQFDIARTKVSVAQVKAIQRQTGVLEKILELLCQRDKVLP